VRAASADCGGAWTKITCTCTSSNQECTCGEWDCGSYPQGTCVPCKPCEGLIPEDDEPGGCDDPGRDGCDSDELRRQLDALKRCITSQQGEKAKIDADIVARQDRVTKLTALIANFDTFVDNYRKERHKLTCREDCLKGFMRETSKVFQDGYRWPPDCLKELQTTINGELCGLEKAKCCLKNLKGKLACTTKLAWEKEQAQAALDKATAAFTALQGMAAWIDGEFKKLEELKNQISDLLIDSDPQKRNYAFYLFFWKFVPGLCRRFPVAICCESKGDPCDQPTQQEHAHKPNQDNEGTTIYIGCEPGDWHPSVITVEKLKQLICCAWDYVRAKEQKVRETTEAVAEVERNKAFIDAKVTADTASLADRIKSKVQKVKCAYGASGR
jgi:hypothetical protein